MFVIEEKIVLNDWSIGVKVDTCIFHGETSITYEPESSIELMLY